MSNAHKRKKHPEAVRELLLEVAAALCLEKGAASLRLDAVASEAGVSKGGLLHHFPSKADLLVGMLDDLIARLEAAIEGEMRTDEEPHGRFTRAYLKVCFAPGGMEEGARWKAMTGALLAEPQLRRRWQAWITQQAERHADTDSSPDCELVRFAADGLWLASLLESHTLEPVREQELMQRLLDLTRS